MQQHFYDLISRESGKLVNLKNMYNVDLEHKKKQIQMEHVPCPEEIAAENERREKLQFDEEIRKEAEEKQLLLQAIINESAASGCPIPKSLIQLLHSQNGKKRHFFSVKLSPANICNFLKISLGTFSFP